MARVLPSPRHRRSNADRSSFCCHIARPASWSRIWFVALPCLSYLLLLFAGVGFLTEVSFAMYAVAAGLVLLVITGIRNAWDLVLWTAKQQHKERS